MKKLLAIALLLIPFFGFSQTTKPIDGFLGIKFGSSKEQVIAAMKAKGAIFDAKNSKSSLFFDNVKLGHRKADVFIVYLLNNKAYKALFVFQPEEQPRTIEYYNSLVNDISENYGAGRPTKDFKSPFTYGDGNEITALGQGYAKMFTDWISNKNSIQVAIDHKDSDLSVLLFYEDGALSAEHDAQQKAKEKSDF